MQNVGVLFPCIMGGTCTILPMQFVEEGNSKGVSDWFKFS